MSTVPRSRSDVAARTLPGHCYTDPAWFQRELERIHFSMWLCAGRADELKEPGSYVTRSFADAHLIILRDEDRTLRAFHNVCRHRGTRLLHDEQGHIKGHLQCR